jgi:hypothetical protein
MVSSNVARRFWAKVRIGGPDECWPWMGATDKKGGYGIMSSHHGKPPLKAHRVSFEISNGGIPDGCKVLHGCDNPPCVNPRHLEAGSQKKNVKDMHRRGRNNPESLLNLRPGRKGFLGAGPTSGRDVLYVE